MGACGTGSGDGLVGETDPIDSASGSGPAADSSRIDVCSVRGALAATDRRALTSLTVLAWRDQGELYPPSACPPRADWHTRGCPGGEKGGGNGRSAPFDRRHGVRQRRRDHRCTSVDGRCGGRDGSRWPRDRSCEHRSRWCNRHGGGTSENVLRPPRVPARGLLRRHIRRGRGAAAQQTMKVQSGRAGARPRRSPKWIASVALR